MTYELTPSAFPLKLHHRSPRFSPCQIERFQYTAWKGFCRRLDLYYYSDAVDAERESSTSVFPTLMDPEGSDPSAPSSHFKVGPFFLPHPDAMMRLDLSQVPLHRVPNAPLTTRRSDPTSPRIYRRHLARLHQPASMWRVLLVTSP